MRAVTSLISQGFGMFASHEFEPWFQRFVNRSYVKLMGLDMHEFRAPERYSSLNALFTRHLEVAREFSRNDQELISPCDALVSECGSLEGDRALQIKGMSYSVNELLSDEIAQEHKERLKDGQFVNFYLSPKDYHRYHMPCDLTIHRAVHIPGKLYPVNMPALKNISHLFIENERVVIEAETAQGTLLYLVLVGALNVGKMRVSFEPRLVTNDADAYKRPYEFHDLRLQKGDDFGCFEMGSTIVMITEKETLNLHVNSGEHVRFAQTIAEFQTASSKTPL
ncbi:MAG: phosphatidylserine decarboxylase [Sulfurimonas sp.]|nr:MAG: phosphatidylserine decarboxylase [Sulfurimonas sp.]